MTQRDRSILMAEVSGGARLGEKLGEAEAEHAVERCVKRIERAAAGHGGRVVQIEGGRVTILFSAPEDTVDAAGEMQRRIADLPPVSGIKLAVRIAFHHGPVVEIGPGCSGEAVELAASLLGLAAAGQVVTTDDTADALPATSRQMVRRLDFAPLRGSRGPVHACELVSQPGADSDLRPRAPRAPPAGELRLRHAGSETVLDGERDAVTLGRETYNDLVITDRRASRSHSRIERRLDKFFLVDESTNGTFVTFEGEPEMVLKHQEVVLRGRGTISFGHSQSDGVAEVVEFEVLG